MEEPIEKDWTKSHKDEKGLADNIEELREMVHYLAVTVHVLTHPMYAILASAAGLTDDWENVAKILHDLTCTKKHAEEKTTVELPEEDSAWLSNLLNGL